MGSPNAGPPAAAVLAPGVPASPGNHAPAAHRAAHAAHEATLLSALGMMRLSVLSCALSAAHPHRARRAGPAELAKLRRPISATEPRNEADRKLAVRSQLSLPLLLLPRSRRLPTQRAARCCAGGDPGGRRQR